MRYWFAVSMVVLNLALGLVWMPVPNGGSGWFFLATFMWLVVAFIEMTKEKKNGK